MSGDATPETTDSRYGIVMRDRSRHERDRPWLNPLWDPKRGQWYRPEPLPRRQKIPRLTPLVRRCVWMALGLGASIVFWSNWAEVARFLQMVLGDIEGMVP